jgi:hypothetical protein
MKLREAALRMTAWNKQLQKQEQKQQQILRFAQG